MATGWTLRCVTCGRTEARDRFTCSVCGDLLGTLDVLYQPSREVSLGAPGAGLFRLSALLPVSADGPRPPLLVGDTPMYEAPKIARRLGVAGMFVKDEGRNPSASMKDRATAVALAHAASIGCNTVAAASTGNAAASLSTLAASMGMRAVIFVPRTAPAPKVAQMLLTGASVVMVDGNYDQAFDLCAEAVRRFGWYSRNTATNPFLAEGKKTCSIEIAEYFQFVPPDVIAVGVGDGCVFGAQHKAFVDLLATGLVKTMPRLVGVQAAGADPLARAFAKGRDTCEPMEPCTFADSISVGVPRDQVKALRAARATGGAIVAVPDDRIREAMRILASELGVFAEPAGAAGLAGLLELADRGGLRPSDRVVAIVSGHGLKDIKGAMSAVRGAPMQVEPGPKALDALEAIAH